jgi:DNA polymerase-1
LKRAVWDVETDGLLDDLTCIHSLVLRDLDTGALVSCTDNDPNRPGIEHGLSLLSKLDKAYGHNVIYFDVPAIKKVYPRWSIREGAVRDTLITARLWKQDVASGDWAMVRRKTLPPELVGKHSLEAWGYRLGVFKGTYGKTADWTRWTPEMQSYCEQDTEVTKRLVMLLGRQALPKGAVETEHELAWLLSEMERNGFPLNVESCQQLYAELSARRSVLDAELREVFQPWVVEVGPFTPKRDNRTIGYVAGCPATKIKIVHFKPSSRDHIVARLKALYGWEPTEFTENDAPKMDDDVMKALPYPEAPKLAKYLLVAKRIGQLAEGKQAWLKLMTDKSYQGGALTGMQHVHGSINQLGAVTHRATHKFPNMSQVPKVDADKEGNLKWGELGDWSTDFRNVWTVPKGWLMLGADASGLELRMLAHFMARYDGGAYGLVILNGDVHAVNRDALGLEGKPGREIAKTFIYAFLYGAGDEKLGSILEPLSSPERQADLGAALRKRFLRNLPALGRLIDDVKLRTKEQGYLTVLDGRRIMVRAEHSALNSLLQTAGAVVCKTWLAETRRRFTREFGPQGWTGKWAALMWSHDEKQTAVRPEIVEPAKLIIVQAIRDMTSHFSLRCPLDGEAKIGRTWAETH